MAKFRDLIDRDVPVLLSFYSSKGPVHTQEIAQLEEVASALGKMVSVIRIDVEKNLELAAELEIKSVPTFLIYRNGQLVWRHTGGQEASGLITLLQ